MDTYSLLREIADSWVLLAMFCFFLGVAIWAFLPSQRRAREDASQIPFRNDNPTPDHGDDTIPHADGTDDFDLKGHGHV